MKELRGNKGVTLLEMMVVVSMIGVLATIAVPTYISWLPAIRANGAAGEVSGDMAEARLKAVSENVLYVVYFNLANGSYSIYRDADAHFLTSSTPNPAELYKTVNILKEYPGITLGHDVDKDTSGQALDSTAKAFFPQTDGAVFSTAANYEIFRPDGTAVYSGAVYFIPDEDKAGARCDRNRAVTVDAMTGFARTWQHPNSASGSWY